MTRAFIPWTEPGEKALIVGDSESLGSWNPQNGVELKQSGPFFFESDAEIGANNQWKLVITNGDRTIWEEGGNRTGQQETTVWFRGGRHASGIEIPVFSLRSGCDCGIGDFGSLGLFISRAAEEGHQMVQILPVDDTAGSANPYDTYSAFAINPMYLDIQQMGMLNDAETAHMIADTSDSLSYSHTVEWDAADDVKWTFFKAIFDQDGKETCNSREFQKFIKTEREWLLPYAAHRCLKGTGDIPPYSEESAVKMMDDESTRDGMLFHMFLQFHADMQLRRVHETARKAGVILGGEITAGVAAGSSEAWQYPQMFIDTERSGSVPDAEMHEGEKWNLMPLDWKAKGLAGWWKRRMEKLCRYYDICRLKDTAGYFRQWTMPAEYGTAVRGHYATCAPYTQKDFKKAGLDFVREKNTVPLITREYLAEVFGPEFRRYGEFFKRNTDGTYYFKADMSTAAAIKAYFDARNGGEEQLRDGLIRIMDECLFVKAAEGYQPRIAAQFTNCYRSLDNGQKDVFNRMYDAFYYDRNNSLWSRTGEKRLGTVSGSSSMAILADCPEPAFAEGVFGRLGILAMSIGTEKTGYMGASMTSTCSMQPLRAAGNESIGSMLLQTAESGAALALYPFRDWHSTERQETDYNGQPISERIHTPGSSDPGWIWRIPRKYTL